MNNRIYLDKIVRRKKHPDQLYRVLWWVDKNGESRALEGFEPNRHPKVAVCRVYGDPPRLTCDIDFESFTKVLSVNFWNNFEEPE